MNRPGWLPPSVTLRAAAATDANAVATVLIESRRVLMPFAPSPHSEDSVHQWVQNQLLPSAGVTVALVDDAVVGVLAVSEDHGTAWIDQLYVHPERVAQGIGSALLGHALLGHALAQLPRPLQLHCFQANVRARHFYERQGFRALSFSDGAGNEERCPDVLYRLNEAATAIASSA